jgi:hypothetical protein
VNTNDRTLIPADLYSDDKVIATVKVPATDGFPDEAIVSYDGKIFGLREDLSASDSGGTTPTIYDEITPYAASEA